ncbi:MAG: acetyl-CoA carboxylase biotin carboxyl carrier protein subunit [Ignavibacteria bacterium]|nr:acetyl-CoA carboxylase biotin carboxyl carrier protein subunit [Ignavibacteria bacterium]
MQDLLLTINGTEYNAGFDKENKNRILINGNPYEIEQLKSYGSDIFSFSVNRRIYQIELNMSTNSHCSATLDGMTFDVDFTDETQKLLRQYLTDSGAGGHAGESIIKAPMPGMVVKVLVQVGDKVSKGDKVVIVEAMKMENVLAANASGVIGKIFVKEGQPVEKDAQLIEIEI